LLHCPSNHLRFFERFLTDKARSSKAAIKGLEAPTTPRSYSAARGGDIATSAQQHVAATSLIAPIIIHDSLAP
jgi:hypothetical protein